jgi:hypothetical protein
MLTLFWEFYILKVCLHAYIDLNLASAQIFSPHNLGILNLARSVQVW